MNIIITEKTRRGVGYLSTEPLAGMYPIGTVFFLDWTWGDHQALTYAVTACHVVAGVRQDIFIEFTSQNGGYRRIRTKPGQWDLSPDTDVACRLLTSEERRDLIRIDQAQAWQSDATLLGAGYEVYIIGLFSESDRAKGLIEPIVRFGRIAHPSTVVPVYLDATDKGEKDKAKWVTATLVECVSFGGASGSPVFICEDHFLVNDPQYTGQRTGPRKTVLTDEHVQTHLFGLVSATWEIDAPVKVKRKEPVAKIGVNSGIAVVIPVPDILKFLMNDPNVKRRREPVPKRRGSKPTTPLVQGDRGT